MQKFNLMINKYLLSDNDKSVDRLTQPDLTAFHRQDSYRLTSTDKKENIYFPRFAFLKISKSVAAHLHVAAFGGWASPTTCKRAAILITRK